MPRVLSLRKANHPRSIELTREDIARGEVEIDGGQLEILSNNPSGYVLRVQIAADWVGSVLVTGLERDLAGEGWQIDARMPSMVGQARRALDVRYKLRLSGTAAPGRYDWPLVISLQDP